MNLFELFASLSLDSSQYEDGLDSAEKTTQSFGGKLKSGLQTAGKVAAGAVTAVSAGAVAMTSAFVNGASELASYGDNIDKMSQKLGLSTDAYQEWDYILGQAGTSIDNMSVGLKTLTNKIDEAKNGSEDAQGMFAKLGISMDDLSDMSREDVFAAVVSGFQGMADSTERAALANDLFGKSGQDLTPLFNASIEDTEKLRKASRNLGFVLSKDTVKASADYADALDTMKRTMGGVKNGILNDMLPAVTSLMEGFTGLIAGQEGASDMLQEGFSSVFASVTSGVSQIAEMAQTILPAITTAIIENLPALAESAMGMMQFFGETMIENLPLIIESALAILQSIGAGIAENLPIIIDSVARAVSEVALMLTNPATLSTFLKTVMTIISTIATSVMKNLPVLISTALQVVNNLIAFVTENLPMFVEMAVEIILAIADGLIEALPQLLDQAPVIIDKLIDSLLAMLPQIVQAGVKLFTSLINNLPQIITTIVRSLPQIISSIVNGIKSAIPQLITAGSQLIQGLWQGISNVGEWLRQKISGFFGGVVQSIKNFFGIKSPSKVFAGIGEMLDRGLAKGVGDYADLAVDAAQEMAEDVFGATDRDFNFTATGNSAPAGRGLVINVYGAQGQDVEELADIISQKIAFGYAQAKAVFA